MYIVKSSNQNKINELKYAEIPNLIFESGEDLPEIDSNDHFLVAAYKSQDSGEYIVIEDSILSIEDENGVMQPVIDIKFRLSEIKKNIDLYVGKKVHFISTIAVNVGDKIHVQTSQINCEFGRKIPDQYPVFGFDDILYLEHDNIFKSLHYFKKTLNQMLSPRVNSLKMIFDKINHNKEHAGYKVYSSPLPVWEGQYQQ